MKQFFSKRKITLPLYPLIILSVILAVVLPVSAGLGIGTNTPDPSAAVDIVSTNQGVLLPRIASPSTSISSPAIGLSVYNTTDKCIQTWNGTAWTCAVGGSSGGTGGSTLPTTINNTVPQVLGANYVGAITQPTFMSVAWVDDNTFAVFSKRFISTALGYDFFIELHNANFGQIREFAIPSMRGWDSTGGSARQAFIAPLKNGNIVVAMSYWTPTSTVTDCNSANRRCWVVAVVDQLGNTVKAMTRYDSPSESNDMTGLYVLDNGNFIATSYYITGGTLHNARTVVFDQAGNPVKDYVVNTTHPNNDARDRLTYSPASFGYFSLIGSVYRSYDFSGTLLSTVNNWIPSSVIDYSLGARGYTPHATRVTTDTNNTMYVAYGGNNAVTPMGIATINVFTASVSYIRNITIPVNDFKSFFESAYLSWTLSIEG